MGIEFSLHQKQGNQLSRDFPIDFELLTDVVRRRDPDSLSLIVKMKESNLTNEEGNKLRDAVGDELLKDPMALLGEEFEPSAYGWRLENLIDAITHYMDF